jgi:hypothetical protein
MHTRTRLAPAIVFSLATVHLALLLADTNFEAFRTLFSSTVALTLLGWVTFEYLLNPTIYKWIGQERKGLSVKQVRTYESSRKLTSYVTDIAGNLGIVAYLGFFTLDSYAEAIQTAGILYLGSVLPNVHHYFWEECSIKLIYTIEIYQLTRRVVAACAIVFFDNLWKAESMPGKYDAYPDKILVIPIVPCIVMTVLRFGLGFLWYGPIFSRVWLASIREFKRDKKFPRDFEKDMPYLLLGGFVCGTIQSFLLLPLQRQMDMMSIPQALKMGYTLFFFYVLPTVSVDMWEGTSIICV